MKRVILSVLLSSILCSVFGIENIALNKYATASASIGANTPEKLNDGNYTSRWESPHKSDGQWVQIDLEDVYELISTKIIWEGASAASYEIQVSKDNVQWNTIKTKTSTSGARTDEFSFDAGAVTGIRYMRLDLKTRTTNYGFSIYEWEIYGVKTDVTPIATTLEVKPENAVLLTGAYEKLEILSLNNSLINYNEQSNLFNQLALSTNKTANWTQQTHLGQSLRYHYDESATSKSVVASKHWTHIILQEQSSKPLDNYADFLESVRLWKDYIKTNCPNPYAKIILFLNWPYTDASDFDGDMAQLYSNYEAIAQELGVSVCPVGKTFDIVRLIDGESAKNGLYTDNRHPTLLASYMSACTVYSSLFGESPAGNPYRPAGINSDDAVRVQNHAWNTYLAHKDIVDERKGQIRYSVRVLDQFNRPMAHGEEISWSVNNGGSITDGIFTTDCTIGTFELTVQAGALIKKTSIEVVKALNPKEDVNTAFISNEMPQMMYINKHLTITDQNIKSACLYDVNGRIIRSFDKQGMYDLSGLGEGIYIVKAINKNHQTTTLKLTN